MSELTKKDSKKARSKTPKKQGSSRWKLVFSVIMMLVWVGASVIVSQLAVGWIMVAILGAEAFAQPVVTAVYSALSYVVAMLLIILVPAKVIAKRKIANESKEKPKVRDGKKGGECIDRTQLGLKGWPTWTDIGLAPVGFIVYMLIAAGLAAVFSLLPWFDASEAQDVGFSLYLTGADRVIAFVTLVVVAPIAEEIIFRGWLYGKLRAKLSEAYSNKVSMVVSILLVSLLFGIAHMQWNVGVNVFAMSIVLCGLREITGTIYAGILMHAIKNGVAFYLLYVLGVG